MLARLFIFLLINFAALGIGGLFTGPGVSSSWYQELAKAPWTPPGWVFGAAWTTIMLCFSVYMARLWTAVDSKRALAIMFAIQWVLNVSWNPVFFYYHWVMFGFIIITTLTALVALFMINYYKQAKGFSWLLVPYFLWLLIASSLNGYIMVMN